MKVNSMLFSLEDMSVEFDLNSDEVNEYRCNPIMGDDLNITFFFPNVEKRIVERMFLNRINLFFHASLLVNTYSKNPRDCDFSDDEIAEIKREATYAIRDLIEEMQRSYPAVVISEDKIGFTDASKVAVLNSNGADVVETWYHASEEAIKNVTKLKPVALVDHGYLLVVSKEEFEKFKYKEITTVREGNIGEFKGKWIPEFE